MKKKLIAVVGLSILIFLSFALGVYAATDIKLFINGKVINSDIRIVDGSSYVPLRVVSETLGAKVEWDGDSRSIRITGKDYTPPEVTLHFPDDKYPETAAHIQAAIRKGESNICTIARSKADENREKSLADIPVKEGYDRDEWPMAMCAEGGTGADIAYVSPADNRGAGSWVSHQLEGYADGTKVVFIIDREDDMPQVANTEQTIETYYKSCAEVKSANKAPLHKGDPGYSTKLDRDGDGVACES